MKKEILRTIKYFNFFDYSPTIDEVYTFLPIRTTKKNLLSWMENLVKTKKLIKSRSLHLSLCYGRIKMVNLYTLPPYCIFFKNKIVRTRISQAKIKKIGFYIQLLSFFSQIKLIGLSGALAMMNAKEEDDIDLFVITAKNRLFTGRFLALLIAQAMGIRRKRHTYRQRSSRIGSRDKVCLNLFFDENSLEVPDFKKNEYVAHEILQMKPLINKENIYERFLEANRWVFNIFPNARSNFKCQNSNVKSSSKLKYLKFRFWILNFICHLSFVIWIFDSGENLLKKLQLYFIRKHQTTEPITDTQLWFHPEDFEKQLPKSR